MQFDYALANYLPEEFHSMLEWFNYYYIDKMNSNERSWRTPQFASETWNLYQCVLNYQNNTNIYAETANQIVDLILKWDAITLWPMSWVFIMNLRCI